MAPPQNGARQPAEPNRPGTLGRNPTGDRPADGSLSKDFRIAAPSVSLPKGGGAIAGMGEKFAANPVTGTASLTVPLPLTPGRGGFTPALSLSYDSGGGNGPFGLGWKLSLPSVRRKTDRGLPRYRDSGEDADTIVLSDAEDLVPLLVESGGNWTTSTRSGSIGSDAYTVQRYRPRVEGGLSLIERWRRDSDGRIHWRTVGRDNTKRLYGYNDQARLTDPDDATRCFEWLLEEERDERGNIVSYQYKDEDRAGVAAHPAEARRGEAGSGVTYRYLKRVSYANTAMGQNPDAGGTGAFRFHLVFDYGEHDETDPELEPPTTSTWLAREDAFSNFRSGFDVRCYRLCRRVLMMHSFTALRVDGTDPVPVVVRALTLDYTERATVSTLDSVQLAGWSWNGTGYDTASMPALSLSYVAPEIDETVRLVTGLDDLPFGLDTSAWRWVDLDGEGLSGLLAEQGGGWFYKRNEGEGALGPAVALGSRPNVSMGGGARLVDLDGDGHLDVVVARPGVNGFYARSADGSWEPFRSFSGVPSRSLDHPDARLLDLDGDGHADLLISEDQVFTWYPSEARDGFGPPERVAQSADEDQGPRLLFSAQKEQIFLADMTGDGLTDLVRIRNGNVCYWPNRGYGRFGARVAMKGAPRFDSPEHFDPGRIRLADVDGSGPTDLLYIGPDGVRLWYNQAGNGFSEATTLSRFPAVAHPNDVAVSDLRGDGTACLVWSSPLLSQASRPLRYVHLMQNGKPWLLSSVANGLGRETRLTYTASTAFYVADRRAGTPWATRLPFPVHCLSKVESLDHVTGWRFVQEYAYHHGYFDGPEREFRGFGLVEQWDTETLHDYEDTANAEPTEVVSVPPVRTKTWFHTGAWRQEGTLLDAYEAEYFAGDTSAHHLAMPDLPSGLSPDELRQAHRALKGKALRVEVYAEDGSGNLDILYTTAETTYSVVRLQPADGETPASFRVDPSETLRYAYDTAVGESTFDPRIHHTLVLEVDDYGHVLRAAEVGYPRRGTGHDDEQEVLTVLVTETEVENQDDRVAADDLWHIGVPVRAKTWALTEITGGTYTPVMAWTDDGTAATIAGVEAAITAAAAWDYDETPSGEGTHLRLIGHQLTLYWDDTLTGPLDPGEIGERALVYERYALAMTAGLLSEVYGTLVGSTELAEAGYVDLDSDGTGGPDGDAWLPSGRLVLDSTRFYQPTGHRDPWGNVTTLTWDTDALAIETVEDPLGLTVEADIDYRWMTPATLTDPNGTETTATFDALGRVLTTAIRNGSDGDGSGSHSAEFTYETSRWSTSELPVRVYTKLREAHGGSAWIESYTYSDGGGQVIQAVTEAEPDPATPSTPRWVVSGRVEVDNKGNVVRQYEPFYASDDEFDFSPAGVSALLSYDPIGRNTEMELPDGNNRTWTYGPWEVSASDENDNSSSGVVGTHSATPVVTSLDSLGRVYKVEELTETGGTPLETRLELDVQSNPLSVTDPRDNVVQVQRFDLLGRPLFTGAADEGYDPASPSTDKGQTRVLPDVASQPVYTWRSGDLALHQSYDAGRRPVALTVDEGSGSRLVTLTIYGDALSDTPASDFAQGRPLHVYDTAGRVILAYDFRGRTVEQTRQVFADIETEADWTGLAALFDDPEDPPSQDDVEDWLDTNGQLDLETFTVETAYDALSRVTEQTTPDGSVLTPGYDAGGKLQTASVEILGSPMVFVTNITYNARGQRESITYGNDTATTTTYDPDRFWITRILTERAPSSTYGAGTLQDLNYERDPVGNIISITDDAQETLYFDNTQVMSDRDFTYDALYRLTTATGREKSGQSQTGASYATYAGSAGGVPDPGDGESGSSPVLRRYTQTYIYDEAGNLTEMKHQEGSGGTVLWRRYYDVAAKNNQLEGSSLPGDPSGTYSDAYSYNDRGAMTYLPHLKTGVSTNLTRDFRDQIRSADIDTSGTVAHYAYDASGQRVRKVVDRGNVVEERIYVGSYEVWRRRSSGDLQQERQTLHVMDGQRRVALIETLTVDDYAEIDPEDREPRLRYQLDDQIGSALLETDEEGGVISYEELHPYGSTAWYADDGSLDTSPKRYRYTGMERDEETGLQYHAARYYAPWLGRWDRPDPIGLGDGHNRFAYVHGGPLGGRDPTGTADPPNPEDGWDMMDFQISLDLEVLTGPLEAAAAYVYSAGELFVGGNTSTSMEGRIAVPTVSYERPQGGVGGVTRGVVYTCSARTVDIGETNPGSASLTGFYVGSEVVPVASPANRLVYGTDVFEQPASRTWAAAELALDLGLAPLPLDEGVDAARVTRGARVDVPVGGRPRGGIPDSDLSGPWAREGTNMSRGGAVTQCAPGSCVSAVGEMLTDGAIAETRLLDELGEWSNPVALRNELNKVSGATTWKGGFFASEEDAVKVARQGPMGAVLQAPGGKGHMVKLSPLGNGRYRVQDPIPGSTYEVDEAWIRRYVSGGVWQ